MIGSVARLALVSLSTLAASTASAADLSVSSGDYRVPVVELYTSEGCSSCPPADRWLTRLGESLGDDFQAVPLAFHVDYWNYLGWRDPFSSPRYTERQREIAANNRQHSIYTPELVVDGREARGGAGIVEAIESANREPATVAIRLDLAGDGAGLIEALFRVDNRSGLPSVRAHLVVYQNDISREIGGGENHGKTLRHDFVVRHWSDPVPINVGANESTMKIIVPEDWARDRLGLALVVLDADTGATLQAVSTPISRLFDA